MRHAGWTGITALGLVCAAATTGVASASRAVAPAASEGGFSLEAGTLALLGAGLVGLALSQVLKRRS